MQTTKQTDLADILGIVRKFVVEGITKRTGRRDWKEPTDSHSSSSTISCFCFLLPHSSFLHICSSFFHFLFLRRPRHYCKTKIISLIPFTALFWYCKLPHKSHHMHSFQSIVYTKELIVKTHRVEYIGYTYKVLQVLNAGLYIFILFLYSFLHFMRLYYTSHLCTLEQYYLLYRKYYSLF